METVKMELKISDLSWKKQIELCEKTGRKRYNLPDDYVVAVIDIPVEQKRFLPGQEFIRPTTGDCDSAGDFVTLIYNTMDQTYGLLKNGTGMVVQDMKSFCDDKDGLTLEQVQTLTLFPEGMYPIK